MIRADLIDEILLGVRTGTLDMGPAAQALNDLVYRGEMDQKIRLEAALAALPKVLELCRDSQNNWDNTTVVKRCFELADELVANAKLAP
jgi:hypothetical protein